MTLGQSIRHTVGSHLDEYVKGFLELERVLNDLPSRRRKDGKLLRKEEGKVRGQRNVVGLTFSSESRRCGGKKSQLAWGWGTGVGSPITVLQVPVNHWRSMGTFVSL